eukprot:Nitzschia sp. Nitz4//scaffold23_size168460//147873//151411//NITZ4_002247-RA/size168460-snap-gene-0.128-mRNA-1//1//CDS//3329543719//3796//frame0
MGESFHRRSGPKADEAELKYIAALQQTCIGPSRLTATVSSLDIQRSLKSRHFLEITHAQARDIVRGLGGRDTPDSVKLSIAQAVATDAYAKSRMQETHHQRWKNAANSKNSQTDEGETEALVAEIISPGILYLDIVQQTSILLIPSLSRLAQQRFLNLEMSQADEKDASNPRETATENGLRSRRKHPASVEVHLSTSSSMGGDREDNFCHTQRGHPNNPPEGLFALVLQNMWNALLLQSKSEASEYEWQGDHQKYQGAPLLTYQLIEALLIENGEMERAKDEQLIKDMMAAASSQSGCFDEAALINALTADVSAWEAGCEENETTYVEDVSQSKRLQSSYVDDEEAPPEGESQHEEVISCEEPAQRKHGNEGLPTRELRSSYSVRLLNQVDSLTDQPFLIVDNALDAYASFATLVLVWLTFTFHSITYAGLILRTDALVGECNAEDFGCTLGMTVISWVVIAVVLTGFGVTVLLPLAFGNHPTRRGPTRMFFATMLALFITLLPFFVVHFETKSIVTPRNEVQRFLVNDGVKWLVYIATSLGLMLTLNYAAHFMFSLCKTYNWISSSDRFVRKFSLSSHQRGTARSKWAATYKVNKMLSNATKMHGDTSNHQGRGTTSSLHKTHSDEVFQNYTLQGEGREECGSFSWTWNQIVNGELFETEGIWLPARLIVFQFGQILMALFVSLVLFAFVIRVAKLADEASANLDSNLPQWVLDIVPSGQEVRLALYPTAVVSVFVPLVILLNYIPSTVKTVLKYRCGLVESLGDLAFQEARMTPDTAYMNIANAIYAVLAASILFFVLIGTILFLFIWDFSKGVMQLILAWAIGLAITILLKMLLTTLCRRRFFRAFYRVFPGRANLTALLLECWFIGLGGGVLVGRISQFLLATAFWIGRIDEPLLADNVILLGYKFDYVPSHFQKDILIHEAHRHPYLERLSSMYLMRLLHRKSFGSAAGACWRQLFVLTLMPWLMQYRVFQKQRGLESFRDRKLEREVEDEENREVVERMVADVMQRGIDAASGAMALGQVGADLVDAGLKVVGNVGRDAVGVGMDAVEVGREAVGAGTKVVGTVGQDTIEAIFKR